MLTLNSCSSGCAVDDSKRCFRLTITDNEVVSMWSFQTRTSSADESDDTHHVKVELN